MDRISLYIKESYNELMNKVTWPAWAALNQTTIAVIVGSVIFSIIIFVMDLASKNLLDLIYGT